MTLSPDEIYRQRSASEPLAPVTLWLYPELREVTPSKQRVTLNNANRRALKYWLSYAMCAITIVMIIVRVWVVVAERVELRGVTGIAWYVAMTAWLVVHVARTRVLLRSEPRTDSGPLVDG